MKRLNILILSAGIPFPLEDGARLILYHLLKRLSLYHNITLLCLISSDEEKQYISYISQYCKVETILHKRSNSNLNRIKYLFSPLPYGINLFYSRIIRKKVQKVLFNKKFDIVQFQYINAAQYAADITKIPKIFYAADCDSIIYHKRMKKEKNIFYKLYLLWQWYRNVMYEKKLSKLFNAAIVVSNADREVLKKHAPDLPIFVAPNGVDTDYFKSNYNLTKERSIIFTGVMDYHPNVSSVLYFYNNIFPLVKKQVSDIKFYIVGKNPTKEIFDLQNFDKSIIVTGYVKDIRPYLEKSAVFVCYMVTGSGIKNKLLEAMSMELPIVANSLAIKGIDALNGRDFFKADRNDEFADKIILLLKDKILARKISISARQFVIRYHNWDGTAYKVDEVYRKILSDTLNE